VANLLAQRLRQADPAGEFDNAQVAGERRKHLHKGRSTPDRLGRSLEFGVHPPHPRASVEPIWQRALCECDNPYIHAKFELLDCFSTNQSEASVAGIELRLFGQRLRPANATACVPVRRRTSLRIASHA
jgi:hypothetical protein